jgi:hypothetical protein
MMRKPTAHNERREEWEEIPVELNPVTETECAP